jgi:hypothetical protein
MTPDGRGSTEQKHARRPLAAGRKRKLLDVMSKAGQRALGGGIAGALAMVVQVRWPVPTSPALQ